MARAVPADPPADPPAGPPARRTGPDRLRRRGVPRRTAAERRVGRWSHSHRLRAECRDDDPLRRGGPRGRPHRRTGYRQIRLQRGPERARAGPPLPGHACPAGSLPPEGHGHLRVHRGRSRPPRTAGRDAEGRPRGPQPVDPAERRALREPERQAPAAGSPLPPGDRTATCARPGPSAASATPTRSARAPTTVASDSGAPVPSAGNCAGSG